MKMNFVNTNIKKRINKKVNTRKIEKKNMCKNKILLMFLFLTPLFIMGFVSSAYEESYPQLSSSGGIFGTTSSERFDNSICDLGKDFIIQIDPLGCEPSIVRSDLLEEQNVQVYCPISATQINPLIDVNAIKNIRITGDLPKEVAGVSFHPARAALGGVQKNLDNSILENIGYVVISLRRQSNESAMPDFVSGNLTAYLTYDIQNAFGVGESSFYLKQVSDQEWEQSLPKHSFWNRKGFLKIEEIFDGRARISVYDSDLKRAGIYTLSRGQVSNDINIKGFDFCMGSFRLKLDEITNPGTRARMLVGNDILEIAEGEWFLDNKCRIRSLKKQGISQEANVVCLEDSGRTSFDLKITPKITLTIDAIKKDYELGDFLYLNPENNKGVYLAYMGTYSLDIREETGKEEDLFVYLLETPEVKSKLDDRELSYVQRLVNSRRFEIYSSIGIIDVTLDSFRALFSAFEHAFREFFQGKRLSQKISYSGDKDSYIGEHHFKREIILDGFSEPQVSLISSELDRELSDYYNEAVSEYEGIIESFPREDYKENPLITLGEMALYKKIELARDVNDLKNLKNLCDNFRERYPDTNLLSIESICEYDYRFSSSEVSSKYVVINGNMIRISLGEIFEPSFEEYSVDVSVQYPDGERAVLSLMKDQRIYLNESKDEFIQLVSLEDDSAVLRMRLEPEGILDAAAKRLIVPENKRLRKGVSDVYGGYIFSIEQIRLEKFAKISIIPRINNVGTEADFNFKIGIEKRAIKLTDEQIKDYIGKLDSSIETLDKISENLDGAVKGLQTACLATGGFLTVKNFISSLRGEGLARQIIMRSSGGWYEECNRLVSEGKYNSQQGCLNDKNDEIERDVKELQNLMNIQNENIKKIQEGHSEKKLLTETAVDTREFMTDYSQSVSNSLENLKVDGKVKLENPNNPDEFISFDESTKFFNYESWERGNFNIGDARDIELYTNILKSSSSSEFLKEIAERELYFTLSKIKDNSRSFVELTKFSDKTGFGESNSMILVSEDIKEIPITDELRLGEINYLDEILDTLSDSEETGLEKITENDYVYGIKDSSAREFILVYDSDGVVKATYQIEGDSLIREPKINPLNLIFKKYERDYYRNIFENPQVKFYETEPYKGLPAIVPFDLNEGWYAATKQSLPVSEITRSFDESGRVNSFYLCNVGANRIQEFHYGIGDDICQKINLGTGQPYDQFPGLSSSEASRLVSRAINAIAEASKQYRSGVSQIMIEGQRIRVGEPARDIPDIQCHDFMSAKECNLLFNLCDPVICPSSRCDFGGAYPVRDVIQSGIFGSIVLCLPNAREGILVPVCLTGINEGIKSFNSIQRSYKDCLEESLETGRNVGICDQIYSIYLCEFFWRQAKPLASIAVPKITELLLGQSVRGGGEYMFVQSAWKSASDSANYLVNYYGANAAQAFKARTSQQVGTEICKNFASAVIPTLTGTFDILTDPVSPAQFHGRFEEIPYTTITSPPTSHYKVFYHIYSGDDSGAYYSVYLRGGATSYYQDTSSVLRIDSGYIPQGGYVTNSRDITAPSGYRELCINVNGQEECGFKEVSTSFALDYVKDKYLERQFSQKEITSEKECISGTPDIYNLLNPNIQEGISGVIDPEVYKRGIIRICSTDSPGKGSDPYDGMENSRWRDVGYCNDEKMRCWVDTKSIEDVIKNVDIKEDLLSDLTEHQLSVLGDSIYLSEEELKGKIKEIEGIEDYYEKLKKIDEIINKIFYNRDKGNVLLLRANTLSEIVLIRYSKVSEKHAEIDSPTFRYSYVLGTTSEEVSRITYPQIYHKYFERGWHWSSSSEDEENWNRIGTPESEENLNTLLERQNELTTRLEGKNYIDGFKILVDETKEDNDRLSTNLAAMDKDKSFFFDHGARFNLGFFELGDKTFIFQFDSSKNVWQWKPKDRLFTTNFNFVNVPTIPEDYKKEGPPVLMITSLEGKDFYEGALMLFSGSESVFFEESEHEFVPSLTDEEKLIMEDRDIEEIGKISEKRYPIFEFEDGILTSTNLEYTFDDTHYWFVSSNEGKEWISVYEDTSVHSRYWGILTLSENNKKIIENMRDKGYEGGIKILIEETLEGRKTGLEARIDSEDIKIEMNHEGVFILNYEGEEFQFEYMISGSEREWVCTIITSSGARQESGSKCPSEITESLEGLDFYEGAVIIFSTYSKRFLEGEIYVLPEPFSELNINGYERFEELFEKYSEKNHPRMLGAETYFRAVLVSIAEHQTNFDQFNIGWLMGYDRQNEEIKDPEEQIKRVSAEVGRALNRQGEGNYAICSRLTADNDELIKCVLGVYLYGKYDTDDRNMIEDVEKVLTLIDKWWGYFER